MTKRRDCGGGRKLGSKDAEKRTRSKATAAKLQSNSEKRAATESVSRVVEREKGKAAHLQFFQGAGSSAAAAPVAAAAAINAAASGGAAGPPPRRQRPSPPPTPPPRAPVEGPSSAAPAAQSQVAEQPACVRQNIRGQSHPQDIYAELDDDSSINDDVSSQNAESSVMGVYLKHVHARLHSETIGTASRSGSSEPWLLNLLQEQCSTKKGSNWWLLASCAQTVSEKLGLEYDEPAYYRDILVWMPDLQWGPQAMPPCVECRSAKHVGVHGMRDGHFGRRVCDLKEHYFIISRRYICKHCEKITAATKQAAVSSATVHDLRVRNSTEDGDTTPQYTFMGYDLRSRSLLPHGYGDDFPAFFTHRSAVRCTSESSNSKGCTCPPKPDGLLFYSIPEPVASNEHAWIRRFNLHPRLPCPLLH